MKYKKLFLLTTLSVLFITNKCFTQIDHIRIMVGELEPAVINYLDSLNKLKTNKYYKIERDITNNGDLMLQCSYSIYDEDFYRCSDILLVFQRFSNGEEVCITQDVLGATKYAASQLNYIKDNFNLVAEGRWERNFLNKYKIVATFERKASEFPSYSIIYELKLK